MPVGYLIKMPKQIEIIGDITLYCGDSLEIMGTLDTVDHTISDPPYEKITQDKIGGIKRNDGGRETEKLNFQAIDDIRHDVVQLVSKITSGWFIGFCTPEGVSRWADEINESTIKYKKCCVWIKPDAMPQLNGQSPASGFENFVTGWCGSGKSKWNAGGKRGVYTHLTNQPDRTGLHPTEKPLPLMCEILNDFTNQGETILDPFMGSGTTLVACAKMGRKGIGIELDQKYFDLACKRVEESYKQGDLFMPTVQAAKQEKLI